MEQYEKSGPKRSSIETQDKYNSRIAVLEDQIEKQGKELALLQREFRRLGTRLDRASAVVNKINGV